MGNRILKKLLDVDNQKTTKTFYTRDAQGNVLSIYENGKQTEIPIYGSDRIGTYSPPQDTIINPQLVQASGLYLSNYKPVACLLRSNSLRVANRSSNGQSYS